MKVIDNLLTDLMQKVYKYVKRLLIQLQSYCDNS